MMRTFLEMVITLLFMIGLAVLFIIVFNAKAEECDKQMGYQCSASQVMTK